MSQDVTLAVKLTTAQRKTLFTVAKLNGVEAYIEGDWRKITSIEAAIKDFADWTFLTLTKYGIGAVRSNSGDKLVSFSEYLALLVKEKPEPTFSVKLNGSHTADVNVETGEVKVGCQTFKLETIAGLVKQADELKKKIDGN